MKGRRGLTLIEVLLTLLLFSVALGLLAGFVGRATDIMRFSGGKDRGIEAARLALDRMHDELAGAILVNSPAAGSSNQLDFVRLNPRLTTRLPNPIPSPPPGSWDPVDPAFLLQVTYSVSGQRLQRRVVHNDGSQQSETLLDQVQSLETERVTSHSIKLTLMVWDSKHSTRWSTLAGIYLR